jgi:hypothetical protein|tara:strand:+ start:747 stop:1010 length:264 start_codon:yes stop_codon:yes gene_type:complete
MEKDKYLLSRGMYVSFWHQARTYAIVKRVANFGIVFQIYKVIGNESNEKDRFEYGIGDTVFVSWHNVPNLKFEKAPVEDEVSYASWT